MERRMLPFGLFYFFSSFFDFFCTIFLFFANIIMSCLRKSIDLVKQFLLTKLIFRIKKSRFKEKSQISNKNALTFLKIETFLLHSDFVILQFMDTSRDLMKLFEHYLYYKCNNKIIE